MRNNIILAVIAISFIATTAMADTIANRVGFTGRVGAAIPLYDYFINTTSETNNGFAWNGGLIYGFNDHLASELDISYLPKLDVERGGVKAYEAKITDIGVGLQYRIIPNSQVVPYVGAGVDFIKGDLKHVSGNSYDLDWTYGGHVNAGLDWFLTKGIALTADLRGVVAVNGDVVNEATSTRVTGYDPYWLQGTLGVRLILPEKW